VYILQKAFMSKKIISCILGTITFLVLTNCSKTNPNWKQDAQKPDLIHKSVRKITDIIVFDIFSPPVASRIYAYSSIAGYEAMIQEYPNYQSMAGQLKGLEAVPKPEAGKEYCFSLAAAQAMMLTAKKWTFSDAEMDSYIKNIHEEYKKINMPKEVFDNSLKYGEAVANHIIAWSLKDNYKESRSAPKYNIDLQSKAKWKPTPPMYAEAIEPHWRTIRTMTMDSAAQFKPDRPTPFSIDKKSQFYKEAIEVYEVGKKNDDYTRETARYWDDNAIATQVNGHFMTSVKKISPGGHWLNIARAACEQSKKDMISSMETYMLVAIGIYDGFISCWDEKYRSEVLRPETYINEYIDVAWRPNPLQTPPFPEYPSGHSVVSGVSATILTNVFGANYAFTDSTEVQWGIPARSFKSFDEAADQAAISRLYGGIHFRPAIENGLTQGRAIGTWIIEGIKSKK
jgi:hypothetical protein